MTGTIAEQFKQVFESRGVDDLERTIDRLWPGLPEDHSDWDPDPDGEVLDLFDDVDDVCRDD